MLGLTSLIPTVMKLIHAQAELGLQNCKAKPRHSYTNKTPTDNNMTLTQRKIPGFGLQENKSEK